MQRRFGADEREKEKAKTQWSALEAIVGSDSRLEEVANDLIEHYETRSQTQPGKAMIVTMSRDICVRLYDKIIEARPKWHTDDHMSGEIKVVMTASASDKAYLQPHHTNKSQKKDLEKRFKDPSDPLKIVIVRDMWLTGFDAPCLATMYVDKPMKGANLAQAIARVNRLHEGKEFGFIVDYVSVLGELDKALTLYSAFEGFDESDLAGTLLSINSEIEKLPERYSALWDLFKTVKHSYDEEAYEVLLADDELLEEFYGRLSAF